MSGIGAMIAIMLVVALPLAFIGGLIYHYYQEDVSECCEGFRQYVLDGQVGGECYHWTFPEHLKGIRGCVVEKIGVRQ